MHEFGDDLEAIQWRCFLLTDAEGVAIGTISAWYSREFRGQDYGRIHWFAIRPGHQGRGLGRAALSYAMQRLAEWHERAWLATSTGRLAAIKLYLDFGFAPDLEPDGARDAWREVATYLDHPGLAGIEEI
jgi:GNAT superfamily N-acetyltransferase